MKVVNHSCNSDYFSEDEVSNDANQQVSDDLLVSIYLRAGVLFRKREAFLLARRTAQQHSHTTNPESQPPWG